MASSPVAKPLASFECWSARQLIATQKFYAGYISLGLAVDRSIVELHGGSADVASTIRKGIAFTLRFPANPGKGH